MTNEELFAALKAPLDPDAIEWRIGQSGKTKDGKFWAKVLAYLTARAVMDRLDDTVGPADWKAEYTKAPHDPKGESVLCTLYLRINGEWIGKADGASASEIEGTKGGISDSLKRAAVCWGIGRYLYSLGESFAECQEERPNGKDRDAWHYAKTKEGVMYWKAPPLPEWALPKTPSASDNALVAHVVMRFATAESESEFHEHLSALRAPDSEIKVKSHNYDRVRKQIWAAIENHRWIKKHEGQAA